MDIGQWVVIGLSALFLAWFLAGAATSRKLGDQVLHWVQSATGQLGRLGEARRIRGSAVQLTMKNASAPFRQLDLIIVLEPRENPPLYLFHHLNGKRDELVLQAILRSAPNQEWEITRVRAKPAGESDPGGASQPMSIQVPPGTFALIPAQGVDPARIVVLEHFLAKYGSAVQLLRVDRSTPHLHIRLRLEPLLESEPQEFIKDLQGLFA